MDDAKVSAECLQPGVLGTAKVRYKDGNGHKVRLEEELA